MPLQVEVAALWNGGMNHSPRVIAPAAIRISAMAVCEGVSPAEKPKAA